MAKAEGYKKFIVEALKSIMAVDSPTGFSKEINRKLAELLAEAGYAAETTNKRLVKVSVKGEKHDKKIAVSAHVDTLGAMVRSISADGKIRFTRLGGPILPTFDGEYCRVYADGGKFIRAPFFPIPVPATSIRTRARSNVPKRPCTCAWTKKWRLRRKWPRWGYARAA